MHYLKNNTLRALNTGVMRWEGQYKITIKKSDQFEHLKSLFQAEAKLKKGFHFNDSYTQVI